MAKHQLFFVHGMGEYDQNGDWLKPTVNILRSAYTTFNLPDTFDNHFDPVAITYDQHFTEYWKKYDENAQNITKYIGNLPLDGQSFVSELVKLAGTQTPDAFWKTHLCDVALYCLTDIAHVVRTDVYAQISKKLKAADRPAYSIIAHSLGTKVIADAFQAAYSDPTSSAYHINGKPTMLMQVANVSRLLTFNGDTYLPNGPIGINYPDSHIRVGSCYNFANVEHPLDPFVSVRPFNPPEPYWGDGNTSTSHLYGNVRMRDSDITDKNIHSLEHYFSHPEVQKTLFQTTTGETITPQALQKAKGEYDVKKRGFASKVILDALQANMKLPNVSIPEIVKIISEFTKITK